MTNPIAKATLYRGRIQDPGHTEYLGELAKAWGRPRFPVMMIWSDTLAVVPVTIHIPLADVARALTAELIIRTARIVDRDLRARFGVKRPRLAVAGLNPHAGEGGAIGREEITIIGPAIEALRPRESTSSDRCPPTRCSTLRRGRATMWRSPCITTRA